MADVLVPIKSLLEQPPAGILGLSTRPGLLSGFVDLPILVPGTVNPPYGISIVVSNPPPAAGRTFTEIPRFQHPWLLVRLFAATFDGQHLVVESFDVEDAQAEIRWYAPGIVRVTLEFSPGWEAHVNYLILLG